MPFGLRNEAHSFQRLINEVLRDLSFTFTYIDDVLITSRNINEHIEHLQLTFEHLQHFGLKINVDKCIFGVKMSFLRHTTNETEISPLAEKIIVVEKFPATRDNSSASKIYWHMINYYGRFLSHCSSKLSPTD